MTTKRIMFIVLSVLLVLVVIVMSAVLTRISDLLYAIMGLGPSSTAPSSNPTSPSSSGSTDPSYSVPTEPSAPPSTAPSSVPTTPKHQHEFVLVHTVPATCETSGYSTYACSCGKDDTRDLTDPLGHDYIEEVIAATCEAGGYTLHKCQRCSSEERSNEVSATGHSYGDWEIAQPPLGDPLTQLQRTCAKCGDVQLQDQPEPPTEPTEPDVPAEPTEPTEPDIPAEPTEPETPETT